MTKYCDQCYEDLAYTGTRCDTCDRPTCAACDSNEICDSKRYPALAHCKYNEVVCDECRFICKRKRVSAFTAFICRDCVIDSELSDLEPVIHASEFLRAKQLKDKVKTAE